MSDPTLSVGTLLSVSAGKPATFDAAGYAALTYTAVGQIESLGTFGGSAQTTEFTPLATGVVQKLKGSLNYGTADAKMADDPEDAGQILLKSGFDGANKYVVHSFCVENAAGDKKYFTGLVSSFETDTGDANTVTMVTSKIEVNSKVLLVPAV